MLYKVPLLLSPQPEGGFTVTSPLLPELVTEGDTVEEALENVRDALAAVVEAYEDLGRVLPINMRVADTELCRNFPPIHLCQRNVQEVSLIRLI